MPEVKPLKLVDVGGGQGELREFAPGDTLPDALIAGLLDKVDKVAGKGLSTEDFTSDLLNKLNFIDNNATANATNGYLLERGNHTGTQPASTITGLGTAATANVQNGLLDITPDRVMTVGAFGLGGNVRARVSPNLNEDRASGFYYCYTPTNQPSGFTDGWLEHRQLDVGVFYQKYTPYNDPHKVFERIRYSSANIGAWVAMATVRDLLGVGQTWQNFGGSRAYGVSYTNSTGKPITVYIMAGPADGNLRSVQLTVNNQSIIAPYASIYTAYTSLMCVVPPGSTYNAASVNGACPIYAWLELR